MPTRQPARCRRYVFDRRKEIMKYRNFQNIGILIAIAIFVSLAFIGDTGNAQNRTRGKATPTPKKSKKATPTPRRAKAKAKPTPKKNAKSSKTNAKAKATPTPKKNSKTASTNKNTKAKKNTKPSSKSKKPTTASSKNSKTPSKNSKTTTAKTKTATVKPKPSPKTTRPAVVKTNSTQIIVSSTSVSLRSSPSASASELSRAKLGSVLNVVEKRSGWYRIQLPNQKTGWIAVTAAVSADKNGNDEIYKQLLAKNTASSRGFAEYAELYEFLTRVQPEIKDANTAADFGLRRLVALRSALKAIPAGQSNQKIYQDFIKAQTENIVYSDPSAEWYVRAPLFWELHSKYTTTASGEKIAWEGAKNPLPGECEGYVNCHIFLLRMTDGEYLNFYPTGGHSAEALRNITTFLDPIAADAEAKKIYNGPTDVSDRAEFNSLITELRVIISRLPNTEKEKALQQLRKIAEGFK